jgi:hypothetical protein
LAEKLPVLFSGKKGTNCAVFPMIKCPELSFLSALMCGLNKGKAEDGWCSWLPLWGASNTLVGLGKF